MSLLAGAARRDISPTTSQFLVGYPHVERMSEGVHDPLMASALYLENDGGAALLISLDILFLNTTVARQLRRDVAASVSLDEASVFISCTHTHSAPITHKMLAWRHDPIVPDPDEAYMHELHDSILAAAKAAKAARQPAALAWTEAVVDGVGCNRLSPDDVRDPEAGVLAVRSEESGDLLAVQLTYSMHPTVLHEDSKLVSGDFPHYAREAIREHVGNETVVLYHTGPEGNQSPRYHVSGQTFAEAERLGRRLGGFVDDALAGLRDEDFDGEPVIAGELTDVELPRRAMPDADEAREQLAKAKATFVRLKEEGAEHGPVRTAECAVFGAEETVVLAEAQANGELDEAMAAYTPVEVQALRIGDACLAGLPGEVFVEYGLALKERAARRTFVVCLVNGDLQGYIVTPEAEAAGGYEAANATFTPEGGEVLVDTAVGLIEQLGGSKA